MRNEKKLASQAFTGHGIEGVRQLSSLPSPVKIAAKEHTTVENYKNNETGERMTAKERYWTQFWHTESEWRNVHDSACQGISKKKGVSKSQKPRKAQELETPDTPAGEIPGQNPERKLVESL